MENPQVAYDNFGQKWITFVGKGFPCTICGQELNDGGWCEDLFYAAFMCKEHVLIVNRRFHLQPHLLK